MQAIILAAGMGRRLGEYTKENTKCMLPVNGVKLIDRVLTQLSSLSLNRVVIVVGYKGQNLINYIGNQKTHHKKISFRDELLSLLEKEKIEFDEKYFLQDK